MKKMRVNVSGLGMLLHWFWNSWPEHPHLPGCSLPLVPTFVGAYLSNEGWGEG